MTRHKAANRLTEFKVYGPFDVPTEGKDELADDLNQFWRKERLQGIAKRRGCYVFALRAGKGYTPWYVGKAAKNFKQECFGKHQQVKYHKALVRSKRGRPVMLLVAHPNGKGRVSETKISAVEKHLLRLGVMKNPRLLQKHGTKMDGWAIQGMIRSSRGQPSRSALVLRKVFRVNGE